MKFSTKCSACMKLCSAWVCFTGKTATKCLQQRQTKYQLSLLVTIKTGKCKHSTMLLTSENSTVWMTCEQTVSLMQVTQAEQWCDQCQTVVYPMFCLLPVKAHKATYMISQQYFIVTLSLSFLKCYETSHFTLYQATYC